MTRLHAGTVFVADDLAAWLVGMLADAGRRKLTMLVLGTDQERALRAAARAAVQRTAAELAPGSNEQTAQLAAVISQVFNEPVAGQPRAGHTTVLQALQSGIAEQLTVLDDASLTGTGQSSADVLGVSGAVVAQKLTGHLLWEIVNGGVRGGPLFPLASQLNDDMTHLQGQRIEAVLSRLADEIRQALIRRDTGRTVAGPVAMAQLPGAVPEAADVECPRMVMNLPDRARLFVGRAEELDLLDKALALQGDVVVQAVHGLGGIGKSTLAARWASLNSDRYNPVWWISADTQSAIDSGLSSLARALHPKLKTQPPEMRREWAAQWLATHQGWLVVLDNVNDPNDLKALLARTASGRFLITSRRAAGWHGIAKPLQLGVMTEAEAVELLTKIASRQPADLIGAAELCEELGYLPLAIEQAGAYITQTGITPRSYMSLLVKYPAEMYRTSAEGGDASRAIARIWDITLDRLAGEPFAGQLLRILAWYAPHEIPRGLVESAGQEFDVLHALGRLAAYSMISIDGESLAMHRLVQAVARTPDADSSHRTVGNVADARRQAVAMLEAALPDGDQYAPWRVLLPHIEALTSRIPPETDDAAVARIINRTALFLIETKVEDQAIVYFERALDFCQRVLGPDHQDTMTCWNNLAFAYQSAGELDLAIALFEQTLEHRIRMLGEDHFDALTSRNNLAYSYQLSSNLVPAISLYEQTLEDRIRILGPDHPQTLTSRSNLAHAYKSAGDLTRAISLYEQTLEDRIRILGPDHPQTLTSRSNLAHAYKSAGDLPRAISLFEQAVVEALQVLPPRHPIVESIKMDLVMTGWMTGPKFTALARVIAWRQRETDLTTGDNDDL
jgi:tetratricopeptide (TPR) repeat protein